MAQVNKRPVISHWLFVNHEAWARVYINDVPLYRTPFVGPDSRSGPLNYLLRPGENDLQIELLKTGPNTDGMAYQDNGVIFQIYTVKNMDAPETEKLDRDIMLDVRHPQIFTDAREEHRHFPLYHRQKFHIDMDLATPIFVDAPEASFDCAGTPELRASVQRIYDLLEARDYEGFLGELALKFRCDEKAHAGDDDRRQGVRMQQWREELLAYEPAPGVPIDMPGLHFEARCGGRVAFVTRHDEGYALDVVCEKDPKRRIRTDLLMVQHGGRWRVFA